MCPVGQNLRKDFALKKSSSSAEPLLVSIKAWKQQTTLVKRLGFQQKMIVGPMVFQVAGEEIRVLRDACTECVQRVLFTRVGKQVIRPHPVLQACRDFEWLIPVCTLPWVRIDPVTPEFR